MFAVLVDHKSNILSLFFLTDAFSFANRQFKQVLFSIHFKTASNKELEAFSYSVSHDLRAPARYIYGLAEILRNEYGGKFDSQAGELITMIMDHAKKMGRLIDDLLAFSQLSRKELIKEKIEMNKMVFDVVKELNATFENAKTKIIISNLDNAFGDKTMIRQVWLNLISNALKYSRLKGKPVIKIGSQIKGKETIYYVKDNGSGFDMSFAYKLFEVFQRLHSDDEFEGTGIGLAIVHRIVTKHAGKVWAEAKVNEGAEFYFTLHKA